MSDIVRRIRRRVDYAPLQVEHLLSEAADRIEALEAALREIIEASQGDDEIDTDWMEYLDKIEKIAIAALAPEQEK
jgi:hypothetical protein